MRAAHHGKADVGVIRHLLQACSQVNQATLPGFTTLHQASRLGSYELLRLLLDWAADPHAGTVDMSVETSSVTRSMTNKVRERGEWFNQSLMLREMNKKQ